MFALNHPTHSRSPFPQIGRSHLLHCINLVCILLATIAALGWATPLHAQPASPPIIIDTDPGVDDALALTWLLSQREPQILGIVSVFGNTTLDQTTNNVLTIAEMNGRPDVKVVKGAGAPLVQAPTLTGWFIHGPDGLWGIGARHPHDITVLDVDYVGFYCRAAAMTPAPTVLALGPLTNLANAAAICPQELARLRVVVLGGAKAGGNKSAVAEFNFWQDPDAVQRVLDIGIRPQIVPLDAFSTVSIEPKLLEKLLRQGNDAVQQLAPAIQEYANAQTRNGAKILFPDLVATIFATDATVGLSQPAQLLMATGSPQVRGQSLVALSLAERLALIADDAELTAIAVQTFTNPGSDANAAFGAILMRQPENAQWIIALDARRLLQAVERGLKRP